MMMKKRENDRGRMGGGSKIVKGGDRCGGAWIFKAENMELVS